MRKIVGSVLSLVLVAGFIFSMPDISRVIKIPEISSFSFGPHFPPGPNEPLGPDPQILTHPHCPPGPNEPLGPHFPNRWLLQSKAAVSRTAVVIEPEPEPEPAPILCNTPN